MDELSNLFGGAEQLWQYIKMYAAEAGREATQVVLELYYVVKSPYTPALDKTLIIAALGYQLLPDDKKLLSREKYGVLGLLDNGAALALAYNRVKTRVTPQIESQVDAILDLWFGSEQLQNNITSEIPQTPFDNENNESKCWEPQHATVSINSESPFVVNRPNAPLGGYRDDEDVIID